MPSYTCLCCGHTEEFDSADASFQAVCDVAPHFALQPPSAPFAQAGQPS
jgi:hypothetical protein